MASVLLPWVEGLPWKQQSILVSGFRGPDTGNYPAVKQVNRWLRTVSQGNADPSKEYMRDDGLPAPLALCDELEWLPCHYVHHLADALAVVAYGHPDQDQAMRAAAYHYRIAEELFHWQPEPASKFVLRHRDHPSTEPADVTDKWYRWQAADEDHYLGSVGLHRG